MLPEKVSAVSVAVLPGSERPGKEPIPPPEKRSRPYLYEVDRLRIVTALSVVAVHVLALMTFLDATVPALQAQNAFVTLFHFTRAVFMFVTAFALVYVYDRKGFSWGEFWKRRGMGVVFPYAFWSFVYLLQDPHPSTPLPFIQTFLLDLLTGQASYQLYYILLTIQFYLLFPFFLKGLRRVAQHPWVVLGGSFALELGILYAIQSNWQAYLPVALNGIKDAKFKRKTAPQHHPGMLSHAPQTFQKEGEEQIKLNSQQDVVQLIGGLPCQ